MKLAKALGLFFGAALVFSSAAVAKQGNKSSVQLDDKVVVEGTSLDTGRYTVEWTGDGQTVQVTLLHGKDAVANFPAHVTQEPAPNPQDAYSTKTEPDGSRQLTAIYPGGKRIALHIDEKAAGQQSSNTQPAN